MFKLFSSHHKINLFLHKCCSFLVLFTTKIKFSSIRLATRKINWSVDFSLLSTDESQTYFSTTFHIEVTRGFICQI